MDQSGSLKDVFKSILDNPSAFIVDQQKDAPELMDDERIDILSRLYETKKLSFLIRYNQFLSKSQLEFIRDSLPDMDGDDEIRYYLNKLIPSKKVNMVKQRRYAALQSLIDDGEYFNDSNMRERNPYLYEQMIGRYLSSKEWSKIENQERDQSEIQRPLSTFLLRQMDKTRREESRIEQEAGEERSNDDDGFLRRIQEYNRKENGKIDEEEEEEESDDDEIKEAKELQREADEERKGLLRKEFTTLMYESFLSGNDETFDYKTVDFNDKYDPISLIDRDAEDSWFDSEEPD